MDGELSPRFVEAFEYAFNLHRRQTRKGNRTPYLAHLMAVSALVLQDGGSEDEAIAGLLHDAVEDQGGLPVLEAIRLRFGERVAQIVAGCSDSYGHPKPPWRERKTAYIQHLSGASPEVLRVSLADKLHNARSIWNDLQSNGEALWTQFKGGKRGTLWYYRALVEAFKPRCSSPMLAELEGVVERIEAAAGAGQEI